jgi:hypothetical protein
VLVTLAQAVGGAVAVVLGVCVSNSIGQGSAETITIGLLSVQNAFIVVNQSEFINCSAASLTDSSLGTSSVYGGAFALLQAPQVSNFRFGLSVHSDTPVVSVGSNVSMLVVKSSFVTCSIFSNATSVRPGESNAGGGALYASSVALTSFSVDESTFDGNNVTVSSGATGLHSFSCGGAVAVDTGASSSSVVSISSCSFFNCAAYGANVPNMAVLGGAVHVFQAARISVVGTNFTGCSIMQAVSGNVVSGGSAISAVVSGNISFYSCLFDAIGGEDMSGTSTGLLVLSRNISHSLAVVSDCVFKSPTVAISVGCVQSDGAQRADGVCVGPSMMLKNSAIFQLPSRILAGVNFSATGSSLMSFQNHRSLAFPGSRLYCALPRFVSLKELSVESSTSTTVYSCRPCLPFHISLTANVVSLDQLSLAQNVDRCFPASSTSTASGCPFAIADCTTIVSVSTGFWTNLSETGQLIHARRCPRGYCRCANATNGACQLPPLISIDRSRDPLCNGKRTGNLCGGCPSGFTQSMDDVSCISNDECSNNMWLVWALSMLGFVVYSLYVVVSCLKRADGAFSCLLFYFQMSSFASNSDESSALVTILEYAQARPIVAMYSGACYAPSMSAYNATAFKLIGPLLVLLFAVAWTWIIQKLQPRLQQRNMDLNVSYSGTLAVTFLFVFSNVCSVVFTLVECSSYSGPDAVVFIDGTEPCMDAKWSVLVFVSALLILFPAVFAAALRMRSFPSSAREAVCGKFAEHALHWGTVTLTFRLFISFTQFLRVDLPNLMAFVRSLLSIAVLVLLMSIRPYIHISAFWVDVACYVCLVAQFTLQGFHATRDFLGVAETPERKIFFTDVSAWSTVIR